MLKIAICDDDISDAKILYEIIQEYLKVNSIYAHIVMFGSGKELLETIQQFELIVLDIVLKNELGTNIAKEIHYKNIKAQILFYSSNLDYASDVFEAYGNGFITKPLNKQKIYICLDRVLKKIKRHLVIFKDINDNILIRIDTNDIDYIKSNRKYSIVHVKDKDFKSTYTLNYWKNELKEDQFFLCKRGLLVNMRNADFVDDFGNLILNSGEKIYLSVPVGKRFKDELLRYWLENL